MDRVGRVSLRFRQTPGEFGGPLGFHAVVNPTGPHQPPTEPIAAEQSGHIKHVASNAPAIGGRRKEPHIPGQCSQIADMVGYAFKFQSDGAQGLRLGAFSTPGQRFDHQAVGHGMADRGIARHRLRKMNRTLSRTAQHGLLDPAVLVTKRDLEVMHGFSVTLKSKMPRFDHSGMNRAHRHFMNFGAFDPVEIAHGRGNRCSVGASPCVASPPPTRAVAHGFQPRVSFRQQTKLLGNLPRTSESADNEDSGTERLSPCRGSGHLQVILESSPE
jgi:hypothetical protein